MREQFSVLSLTRYTSVIITFDESFLKVSIVQVQKVFLIVVSNRILESFILLESCYPQCTFCCVSSRVLLFIIIIVKIKVRQTVKKSH